LFSAGNSAKTNGLNQFPRRFYPHRTAILNTLSQVSGVHNDFMVSFALSADVVILFIKRLQALE
jgi:hypothetical protein